MFSTLFNAFNRFSQRPAVQTINPPAFAWEAVEGRLLFATTPAPAAPIQPPPPKPGVHLVTGTLAVGGDAHAKNAINVSLSTDGKTVVTKLNGKTTTFATKDVHDIVVAGGDQNDTIVIKVGPNTGALKLAHPVLVHGGAGNDTLTGGNEADAFYGDAGNDSLIGNGGNDALFGGPGHDTLRGNAGNDTLFGDSREDLLDAGTGTNIIHDAKLGT